MSMVVLVLDLKNGTVTENEWKGDSLGLRCAFSLHSEYGEDSLVLACVNSEGKDGRPLSWPVVYHSDITGKTETAMLNTGHGLSLLKLGIAALVIIQRADKLKYITLSPSKREILPIENMRAESSLSFESVVTSLSEISLSTGVAADKGVWFGALQYRGRNIDGTGLGHAFFAHNLKGIVFPSFFSDSTSDDAKASAGKRDDSFLRSIRSYGEYAVIPASLRLGWAAINNYSDRFDPRLYNMDGKSIAEKFGNYPSGCPGCSLKCLRTTREGEPLPSWRDLFLLGSNLGFFNPSSVMRIYSCAVANGLETATLGAVLSHIISLPAEERSIYGLCDVTIENILTFIKRVATGSVLPKGLVSLPMAVQGFDHRPVLFDLRGAFVEALLYSQGFDFVLPATLYFAKRNVTAETAAVFALYETVYALALRHLGCPSDYESAAYWSRVPQLAYSSPFFARLFLRHFSAFGYKSSVLLPLGFDILQKINPLWHPVPERFIMDSTSSFDASTVPLRKMQDLYDSEKLRLLIFLKSRRLKSVSPDGEKSNADGGRDERGSEADPGLAR